MPDEVTQTSEVSEKPVNPIEYPFEYFDAQVRFALKWAEISGEPPADTLLDKTALHRRLNPTGDNSNLVWQDFMNNISASGDPTEISNEAYGRYLSQPQSRYAEPTYPENDGKHFGYFAFDYFPQNSETGESNRIKVHFINRQRGEKSGLDPEYLPQRQADLKRMFAHIQNAYPQADEVVGGSWLYALKSYRDSFPPGFTIDMKQLVPKGFGHIPNSVPNMSFHGNSLWGQFVDRRGNARDLVYREFLGRVDNSKSLDDLVDAFPNKPYQPKAPISIFYDWTASGATS